MARLWGLSLHLSLLFLYASHSPSKKKPSILPLSLFSLLIPITLFVIFLFPSLFTHRSRVLRASPLDCICLPFYFFLFLPLPSPSLSFCLSLSRYFFPSSYPRSRLVLRLSSVCSILIGHPVSSWSNCFPCFLSIILRIGLLLMWIVRVISTPLPPFSLFRSPFYTMYTHNFVLAYPPCIARQTLVSQWCPSFLSVTHSI